MQLLLIGEKTVSVGCSVGDIVGIFPDTHEFSVNEMNIFNVVSVDMTEEEINAFRPQYEEEAEGERVERPRFELHYADGIITANSL